MREANIFHTHIKVLKVYRNHAGGNLKLHGLLPLQSPYTACK